jgi:hypothetical protein
MTEEKAKRANKMQIFDLPWAQAVPGSIAPDQDFEVPNLARPLVTAQDVPNELGDDRELISSRIVVLHLYSIKRRLGVSPWKQESFKLPEINAVDPMFCIFNRGSISQAGRRGFDSRLPLHPFNHCKELFSGGVQ